MSFRITTDSSSNLPAEYVREHSIDQIAFTFQFDDGEHALINTDDFDGKTFYDMMRAGTVVTTSQINPQRYMDFFTPFLEAGEDVLHISMSSGISGAYNCSVIAAEELSEKYPDRKLVTLDTRGASLGEGLLVYKAVELRAQGKSFDETLEILRDMAVRMYQVFTVDELKYLRRTGRISNATAIVGTVLNIKPLLKGNELGQIVTFDKVRGRKKSIETIAKKYEEVIENASEQIIGIAHADCQQDAETLADMLRQIAPPKQIVTVMYEPVTGSHVGPGTLALFFCGGLDSRSK